MKNNSHESESCEDPTVYSSAVTYLFRFPNHSFDFFYYLLTKKLFYDYKCRTYFFVYRCHKPIHSYMMSPAGSLPPLDMKDNMSRLVLSRCENWLFKQFASLCCCCWTRQSRTGPAERFWVECSVIQFVHLVSAEPGFH